MDSIPVIGTVLVNYPFWISRLLMSVDYPVDNFVIFNNNGRGELTEELDNIVKLKHRFIKKVSVCHLPANIGCPSAWNLIIKSFINSPYWVIVNNDVAFTPGLLEQLVAKSTADDVGMVFAKEGEFKVGCWDLFLLKDIAVRRYGLFDENFYPAYCEDVDYIMRFVTDQNRLKYEFLDMDYLHGDTFDYGVSGSQTWRAEPELKEKIDAGRYMNEHEYMNEKWGVGWRWCEPYKYPYNDPSFPKTYTTYSLDFVRRKYMGF